MTNLSRPPRRLRNHALAAILDQGFVAGASFVLMILVRRSSGASALGEYGWLIAVMIVLTGMQTAWIGDSLTVGDRFAPRLRSGLWASLIVFSAIGFLIATGVALTMQSFGTSVLFGAMVVMWLIEETGRRIFMARMEFWHLVVNDIVYAVAAFAALGAMYSSEGHVSVTVVIAAMAVGAAAAITSALLQLPHDEYSPCPPSLSAMREMTSFAGWRALQLGIRPFAQFLIRTLVIVFASRFAAGNLESARLFSQPAITYVSGLSSILLPMYAASERGDKRSVSVGKMTVVMIAPVVLYAAVAIAWRSEIAERVFRDASGVSPIAVVGWMATALMFAAGLPAASLLVARRESRAVFLVRAADSFVGLALAAVTIRTVSPSWAPSCLAVGMLVGTAGLIWLTRRPANTAPEVSIVSERAMEASIS